MKRLIVVLSVILSLSFTISCGCVFPNPEPEAGRVGRFDTSKKPSPLLADIEIVNELSEELSVSLKKELYGVWYHYDGNEPYELKIRDCYEPIINNLNIKPGETSEIGIPLMHIGMIDTYFSRIVWSQAKYVKEDYKTVFPGVSSFCLSGIGDSDYHSAGDIGYQFGKDVWNLTAEDFEALGGDFYYILDPEKSGTTSFGHVVSSDDNLKGKESGHVKIKLTIKDDPENEGKRLVEFAYLGEVTEGE